MYAMLKRGLHVLGDYFVPAGTEISTAESSGQARRAAVCTRGYYTTPGTEISETPNKAGKPTCSLTGQYGQPKNPSTNGVSCLQH